MNQLPTGIIEPISLGDESTVAASYEPRTDTAQGHQTEAQLEAAFIADLTAQAYEYAPIHNEHQLVANLRTQLEELNDVTFSDSEWDRFFSTSIAGANEGIYEKTRRIQEDHVQVLTRDDGSTKNIRLIDKTNIHNNRLQVMNQYTQPSAGGGKQGSSRYDVTILVNGLPLVHVELKRRGVSLKEAFNQIDRYGQDAFCGGSGLFNYVHIFVISNGTHTRYYSNTTRAGQVSDVAALTAAARSKTTDTKSYVFTSQWTDVTNTVIMDLDGFTRTFFAKHTLLAILTRYCVLNADKKLLVMRPYQIAATEAILRRITIALNDKTKPGTIDAGGYIWHTTGSGKTLTSFKTAQLASRMPGIGKVLFVVDRKDLDYQTMKEYDSFQKGAANSNVSTKVLQRQLEDPDAHIIITTIQKLSTFIRTNPKHAIYDRNIVLIFDECHRSQFGEMHRAIRRAFRRYMLFGFTGTPIFPSNSSDGIHTTEQVFGERLHSYTIVDAIKDRNVLPFRIDYVSTMRKGEVADEDKRVSSIDTKEALLSEARLNGICTYILAHFDQHTKDRRYNALLATESIPAARAYYNTMKLVQDGATVPKLKVGIIYSNGAGATENGGVIGEEGFDTAKLSDEAKQFLDDAINDYNTMYGTSFSTAPEKFEAYYKDLSQRMKRREIDLVIVVNMFLTGFDAKTMNTLFVDKHLHSHGLIQAFSRTNRILDSVKSYGNIVCFRDLEMETNLALQLFGDKDAHGIVLLKTFGEYYEEYREKVDTLKAKFPIGQEIVGEENEKEFARLFGEILRFENVLSAFDEFADLQLLSEREHQDYQSMYLDIHERLKPRDEDGNTDTTTSIVDDIEFEIELVKRVQVDVDYILKLINEYREQYGSDRDREYELLERLRTAIASSPMLRAKGDLLEDFLERLTPGMDAEKEWPSYLEWRFLEERDGLIDDEGLNVEGAKRLIDQCLRSGEVSAYGTAISSIMPRMSLFGGHEDKQDHIIASIRSLIARYGDILGDTDDGLGTGLIGL